MREQVSRRNFLSAVGGGTVLERAGGYQNYMFSGDKLNSTPADIDWSRQYTFCKLNRMTDVIQTSDDGYLFGGYTGDYGQRRAMLVKLSGNGTTDWVRTYQRDGNDFVSGVIETDSGYLFAGGTSEDSDASPKCWVVAVDESGRRKWDRTYAPEWNGFVYTVLRTDSGILLGTSLQHKDKGHRRAWLGSIDPSGRLNWSKTYGDTQYVAVKTLREAPSEGYYLGGSKGGDFPNKRAWILRLDGSGQVIWNRTFSSDHQSAIESLLPVKNGGFVFVGNIQYDDWRAWLVQGDEDGHVDWRQRYSGRSEWFWAYDVVRAEDGYLIVGTRELDTGEKRGGWVIRTSGDGRQCWQRTYKPAKYGDANTAVRTPNGSFVLGGRTGDSDRRAWAVQIS